MKEPAPIFTAHLFPQLDALLISFLQTLSDEDWHRQTLAPNWKIKDVAAHLLDGNIRLISTARDNYVGEKMERGGSYSELVQFLNRLNAEWTTGMRRASPRMLLELLEITGKQYSSCMAALDPFAESTISVAWAGESRSMNWFHIAREYTEKWHHQQQMRFALGNDETLLSDQIYLPYLETSMRALPYHYRNIPAVNGDSITFRVPDITGGEWHLIPALHGWELCTEPARRVCTVEIDKHTAWKIFTKEISSDAARLDVRIEGDTQLGEKVLNMAAVMV